MLKKSYFGAIMKKLIVNGGIPLRGRINVNGSKNAALPMLFASIIAEGISVLDNFPYIGDTEVAMRILESLGVSFSKEGKRLYIDTRNMKYVLPDPHLTAKLRASTYLIGGCLARFGRIDLPESGGCNFASRPIDLHVYAAERLGARREGNTLVAENLQGRLISLSKPSVGATANALILASRASGITEIRGGAREPHILSLIDYLRSMGASIEIVGDSLLVSSSGLHSGRATVIGDMIEAATYLIAGVLTEGSVEVSGVDVESLSPFLLLLSDMGATVDITENSIKIYAKSKLKFANAIAEPYPGLPTDIQPLLAPLFAFNSGGHLSDRVFEGRFGYLSSLIPLGARYRQDKDGTFLLPSLPQCGATEATDLRGGAACLLCALAAPGESVISSAQIILRGYECPDCLLRSLGGIVSIE